MSGETAIIEVMKRLYYRGLNMSQSGNASMRIGSRIAITPSAFDKPSLKTGSLSYLELPSGRLVKGSKQSSEYMMHLMIYKNMKEASAVVHAHPPYLLAFVDALGTGSLKLNEDQEVKEYVKGIGIIDEEAGTKRLAESMVKELTGKKATTVVMKGHGVTSIGYGKRGIYEALNRVEVMEHLAMRRALAYLLGKK